MTLFTCRISVNELLDVPLKVDIVSCAVGENYARLEVKWSTSMVSLMVTLYLQ